MNSENEKPIQNKVDCMIINFWSAINYGAILTCYGVQCLAEKLGKTVNVINNVGYRNVVNCKNFKKSFSYNFAKKYLNLSMPVKSYDDLFTLNNYSDTFITGSDQVFRNLCAKRIVNGDLNWSIFFLDFVRSNKRKLSYSASFGTDIITGTPEELEKINFYLSQFDDISVREDTGVELIKQNYNLNSTQIADGAFNIPKEKLEEMTAEYKSEDKYIGCFTLPYFKEANWYSDIMKHISKKYSLPVKDFSWDYKTPVEEWLAFIKNAQFVITDSYHCTVFCLIFNIPFLHVQNAKTQNRFDSLFRLFNIPNNKSVNENSEINYDEILKPLDWEFINNKIAEEKLKAENWMRQAFEKPIENKPVYPNFLETDKPQHKAGIDIETLKLILNKDKIKRKYIICKILANITFGKKREHYKKKKKELKAQVTTIRKLLGIIK